MFYELASGCVNSGARRTIVAKLDLNWPSVGSNDSLNLRAAPDGAPFSEARVGNNHDVHAAQRGSTSLEPHSPPFECLVRPREVSPISGRNAAGTGNVRSSLPQGDRFSMTAVSCVVLPAVLDIANKLPQTLQVIYADDRTFLRRSAQELKDLWSTWTTILGLRENEGKALCMQLISTSLSGAWR